MRADGAKLTSDVTKEAGKAGDAGAKTLGQRLGKGLSLGVTAVGTAAGAVFGIAARGAAELTDAMAKFQAETGATQEELDSARKSILELSKTNLQSFDEIASTQAKLRTDLGLTQAEAEKATNAFLKYGTATGRDATEGVAALDDILDAWNLDSSKSTEIMDKLVASHQKYGGSLTENESALNNLAPQLQALNLNVDDGISLLNLFAAGGLDASKAQFALNSAIQKLPPGTSLEEFVAHLATIEDPTRRATEAIKVFGARGGAGLANVIRPGMKGLDDFAIGMDDAAGATERAADAIEKTPLNQLKMALRAIAAPAIEAGQSFGPLIMALSQLGGGKLVAAVAGALGGLTGKLTTKLGGPIKDALVKVFGGIIIPKAAMTGIGESMAEGIGSSVTQGVAKQGLAKRIAGAIGTVAIPIAITFVIAEAIAQLGQEQIEKDAKPKIAELTQKALTEGTKEGLEKSISQLRSIAHNAGRANPTYGAWVEAQIAPLQEKLDKLNGVVVASTDGIGRGVEASLGKQKDDVARGAQTMMSGVGAAAGAGKSKGASLGSSVAAGVAQGMYDTAIAKQSVVQTAFQLLLSASKNTMHKVDEINYLVGVLTSKELAHGLTDTRASVRAAAEETRAAAEARLAELRPNAGNIGKKTGDELSKGLKSKDPQVRAQARRTAHVIETTIRGAKTRSAGQTAGQNIANGINDKSGAVGRAAAHLASVVYSTFIHSLSFSAAHHTNPKPPGKASGGDIAAYTPTIVGERVPELFIPEVPGHIYPNIRAGLNALEQGGGGTTVQLQTYGLPLRAETPLEVALQLRRVTTGLVAPRRRMGWSGA